jgi:signal peptidase I
VVVPRDSLFVLGDNRDGSYDGRYWGFLPRKNVRGTPVLVYFSYDATQFTRAAFLTEVRWRRLFSVPD